MQKTTYSKGRLFLWGDIKDVSCRRWLHSHALAILCYTMSTV